LRNLAGHADVRRSLSGWQSDDRLSEVKQVGNRVRGCCLLLINGCAFGVMHQGTALRC